MRQMRPFLEASLVPGALRELLLSKVGTYFPDALFVSRDDKNLVHNS